MACEKVLLIEAKFLVFSWGAVMSIALDELEFEILSLPLQQRARLLDRLKSSLEAEQDVEAAWVREALRRRAQIESCAVEWVSGDDALARLRERFR